jgi:hypothetical protein
VLVLVTGGRLVSVEEIIWGSEVEVELTEVKVFEVVVEVVSLLEWGTLQEQETRMPWRATKTILRVRKRFIRPSLG